MGYSDTPEVEQQVLYSSLEPLPKSVYKGQLFGVTIKTLSTEDHFQKIDYQFERGSGVILLEETPQERFESPYYYHTFYFLAQAAHVRIPDITATLVYSDFLRSTPASISGKNIEVIKLNPPANYVGVIADELSLTQYKTNHYDEAHNIALFSMKMAYGSLSAFSIPGYEKQGFESNATSVASTLFTYYVLLPKHLEELRFSYFNQKSERFESLLVPIVVSDDSVSTQSDLKPTDQRHTQIKIFIALGVAAMALLLFVVRRKIFYLFVMIPPLVYSGFIAIPIQHVCVKSGTPILLLPMEHGTIFETTTHQMRYEIEGKIDGYIKIKLKNNKIGWVKNETLCTP